MERRGRRDGTRFAGPRLAAALSLLIAATALALPTTAAYANKNRPCGSRSPSADGATASVATAPAVPVRSATPHAEPLTTNDWPRFHFGPSNGGRNYVEHTIDYLNVPSVVRKWRAQTGGAIESSPVVVGGTVFVGSNDHSLYAFDRTTGHQLWRFGTGGSVRSTPAAGGGVVYVGSEDGNVYAVNANSGKLVWKHSTGGGVYSSPNVSNGVVYVGSRDSKLYALKASDGSQVWAFDTGGPVTSSPAVFTQINGTVAVYVGSGDRYVYALKASTGAKLWAFKTGGAVESSPAVAKWNGSDILVIGSDDFSYYGLNADTGARKWACATTNVEVSSPALNPELGRAYWGTHGWDIQGHNLIDGLTQWSYTCGAGVPNAPAVANGVVYSACGKDRHIYALRETLKDPKFGAQEARGRSPENRVYRMVWNYDTGAQMLGSPAISYGMIFIGNGAGYLYAFGLP